MCAVRLEFHTLSPRGQFVVKPARNSPSSASCAARLLRSLRREYVAAEYARLQVLLVAFPTRLDLEASEWDVGTALPIHVLRGGTIDGGCHLVQPGQAVPAACCRPTPVSRFTIRQ